MSSEVHNKGEEGISQIKQILYKKNIPLYHPEDWSSSSLRNVQINCNTTQCKSQEDQSLKLRSEGNKVFTKYFPQNHFSIIIETYL